MIMFRIESRARARDIEIRKSAAAPRPEPGTVAARPGGISWEMAAATAAGQASTTVRSRMPPNVEPEAPARVAAPMSAAPTGGAGLVPGPLGFVPAGSATDELEAPPSGPERPAAPARVPTGPRLHLRVVGPDSMIATLDGESEAVTLAELPETAKALANADGSAVIATGTTGSGAASLADQAFRIFAVAGVPTTTGD
jgi:hypothetical protein